MNGMPGIFLRDSPPWVEIPGDAFEILASATVVKLV